MWVTAAVPGAHPVTVTGCAVLQFDGVNVSAEDTVALAPALLAGVTVTFAVGLLSRTTV